MSREHTLLTDKCLARYFETLHFSWPYDLRDMYSVNTTTQRCTFSNEFERRYHDLQNWSIRLHREESPKSILSSSEGQNQVCFWDPWARLCSFEADSQAVEPLSDRSTGTPTMPGWFSTFEDDIWAAMNN